MKRDISKRRFSAKETYLSFWKSHVFKWKSRAFNFSNLQVAFTFEKAVYGVATISRLLKIIRLFAEYSLLNRAILQKRFIIVKCLLIVATAYLENWNSKTERVVDWYFSNGRSLSKCCSVLQCVAVCCGVLQCVAVCCSVLQCVAVCYSVLQCVAVCWNV